MVGVTVRGVTWRVDVEGDSNRGVTWRVSVEGDAVVVVGDDV